MVPVCHRLQWAAIENRRFCWLFSCSKVPLALLYKRLSSFQLPATVVVPYGYMSATKISSSVVQKTTKLRSMLENIGVNIPTRFNGLKPLLNANKPPISACSPLHCQWLEIAISDAHNCLIWVSHRGGDLHNKSMVPSLKSWPNHRVWANIVGQR